MELKEIIHKECGEVALLCKDREYSYGEQLYHDWFYHTDEKQCVVNEEILCDFCKKPINLTIKDDKTLGTL